MAWQNVEVNGVSYSTIDPEQFTNTGSWSVYEPLPSGYSFQIAIIFRENGSSIHGNTDFWAFGNSSYGILVHNTSGYEWNWKLQFYLEDEIVAQSNTFSFGSSIKYYVMYFSFGINEDEQKGSVIYTFNSNNSETPSRTYQNRGDVLNNSSFTNMRTIEGK